VQLEVVELLDDLLPRLAGEELLVLHHRGVHLFEAEAARHGAEVAEEPRPETQVLRVEVAGAARGLKLPAHAHSITRSAVDRTSWLLNHVTRV